MSLASDDAVREIPDKTIKDMTGEAVPPRFRTPG